MVHGRSRFRSLLGWVRVGSMQSHIQSFWNGAKLGTCQTTATRSVICFICTVRVHNAILSAVYSMEGIGLMGSVIGVNICSFQ